MATRNAKKNDTWSLSFRGPETGLEIDKAESFTMWQDEMVDDQGNKYTLTAPKSA